MYPLNGLHGTRDISPYKNPPGKPNGVHLAPGPFGHPQGSYQFSGSSTSYIEIPNNGGLDTRYSITILAWLNQENDNGPIVNFGSDVWGFHFWVVNGSLFARPSRRADGVLQSGVSSSLETGTWKYVGTSYNFSSGVVKLWINGSEVAHTISGSEEQSTEHDVRVGAGDITADPRYLQGRICCLQIYNRSLSQQEIIAVQNRTLNICEYGVSSFSVIVRESVPEAKSCGQPIWLKLGAEVGCDEIFQKPLWLTSLTFSFEVTGGGGVSFFAL